jgi:predicted Zn-dependent protease with MMP-like domain
MLPARRRECDNAAGGRQMNTTPDHDPDLETIERLYDALDGENPEEALRIAREAMAQGETEDPVVHFLTGLALLELDRPEQAAAILGKAVELDPDDADIRANLALSLFLCCRFGEGEREASKALDLDEQSPDGHYVTALLLERSDRFEDADRHFERAAKLDPERFMQPLRLASEEFAQQVLRARAMLDDTFASILDEVVVTVEQLPSEAILLDDKPPLDPELLGLFVGVPRLAASAFSPGGELPPRILLFKRTLERFFPQPERLAEEIATTLHHELGHYVGKEEDEMGELRLL